MASHHGAAARRRVTPLTVAECLTMPYLREARVVGGTTGLPRVVRWVHVVDVPNVEECLVGGELVMTSGISLGHDQGLQRRIVPVMVEMDLAGLVVALGPYVQEIPPRIREAADAHGVPVLALPWEVNFRDVIETIQTAIVDRQRAMLEQSLAIHGALTSLVLEGGGLPALSARLTHLLGRSTAVLDPLFHPLAGAPIDSAGPITRSLLAHGGPSPGVTERLRTLSQRRPRETASTLILDEGEVRGVLVPVVVERQLHGYLWVDGATDGLAAHELLAAEHGATVAALMLYKDEAVRQAERRRERDTLDRLLDGGPLDAETADQAERLLSAARAYVVLVVGEQGGVPVSERLVEDAARRVEPSAHARWRTGQLVVVAPASDPDRLAELAGRLQTLLRDDQGRVPGIGIGETVSTPSRVAGSYRTAREALRIGRHADPDAAVHRADQLSSLRCAVSALGSLDPGGDDSPIARLASYDRDHDGRLIDTLEAYLRHDGNATTAARALGIHRHTLLYRLQRIADIGRIEITPATRLDLRLGLLLYRLGRQSH